MVDKKVYLWKIKNISVLLFVAIALLFSIFLFCEAIYRLHNEQSMNVYDLKQNAESRIKYYKALIFQLSEAIKIDNLQNNQEKLYKEIKKAYSLIYDFNLNQCTVEISWIGEHPYKTYISQLGINPNKQVVSELDNINKIQELFSTSVVENYEHTNKTVYKICNNVISKTGVLYGKLCILQSLDELFNHIKTKDSNILENIDSKLYVSSTERANDLGDYKENVLQIALYDKVIYLKVPDYGLMEVIRDIYFRLIALAICCISLFFVLRFFIKNVEYQHNALKDEYSRLKKKNLFMDYAIGELESRYKKEYVKCNMTLPKKYDCITDEDLDSVINFFHEEISEKTLSIKYYISDAVKRVSIDVLLVQRALLSFITDSIQVIQNNGNISIEIDQMKNKNISIIYKDNRYNVEEKRNIIGNVSALYLHEDDRKKLAELAFCLIKKKSIMYKGVEIDLILPIQKAIKLHDNIIRIF